MSDSPLVLIVAASYAGAIGYAEVFNCQIRETSGGTLEESTVRLNILASDKDWIGFLFSHPHPQEIELAFTLGKTDEPYRSAPISGFVDRHNTSWKLMSVREAPRSRCRRSLNRSSAVRGHPEPDPDRKTA